ncbi:GNAT family N-acetyltransferase [Clostridium frigidicarnis]|uniref:Uncharacterized protein n=1 Tax=Clostridium frigidicarnis TaxID=84698 RepID=A0A1I0YA55_9CLOT|nr:GNAT family N-acetyltransferase [Clostridium frigidicarnis]SFB10219.1 hypothetical protein SAMN04488528_101231 [Clostridium frigidicarnis]
MNLSVKELTEAHAKEICNWGYKGEYCIYNYPSWEQISNEKRSITIEQKRKNEFYSVVDDCNCLCGYMRLMNKDEYILIGIGLKTCLCGQGLGKTLMKIVKNQCKNLYPHKKIVLEVRSFNCITYRHAVY